MPRPETLRHLAEIYSGSDDPWSHLTSIYEKEKYDATLVAIGSGPFEKALEIGCGNGTLLARIAPRCRIAIGVECIPEAARQARMAVSEYNHVTVLETTAPQGLPNLSPDLVVLSEVLYFLSEEEIFSLADWLNSGRGPARPRIVCINWLGATDEPLNGNDAMAAFARSLSRPGICKIAKGYRIDIFPS